MRLLALAMAVLFVAACAEREQVADAGERTYQGKRDTRAWDNAPLEYGGAHWSKGDAASWEKQIKVRQLTQNAYGRMER